MKILTVEDDRKISSVLGRALVESGYAVDAEYNGQDGLNAIVAQNYDLVILDMMLPNIAGLEVCRRARLAGATSPILILTALSSQADKVMGLDNGADDYLVKPFHIDELLARVRALMRRNHSRQAELVVGNLSLDPATRLAKRGDTQISLTAKEYALLEYLMRNPGKVVSESELIEHVWDSEYDGISNVVRTYIKYVRKKISPQGEIDLIHTKRGHGYMISDSSHV